MAFRLTLILFLLTYLVTPSAAQTVNRRTTIAVILLSDSELGRRISESYAEGFAEKLEVLDSDLAKAAAQGAGFAPSLNMAVSEARTFGAAVGSDFFVLVDAKTHRRSPSTGKIYFDSYASIFLVSSRSGRLWRFLGVSEQGPTEAQAEKQLLKTMSDTRMAEPLIVDVRKAKEEEQTLRASAVGREIPVIEAAPDDEKTATAAGLQLPRPYRRLQPPYSTWAAMSDVEAVVDVLVDLDKNGDVVHTEIVRWAGFDLDEAVIKTVRQLHFFPAMRNGTAIPMRVLLRYNFRKPPR